jgi:hypothetical protein
MKTAVYRSFLRYTAVIFFGGDCGLPPILFAFYALDGGVCTVVFLAANRFVRAYLNVIGFALLNFSLPFMVIVALPV